MIAARISRWLLYGSGGDGVPDFFPTISAIGQ